MILLNYLIEKSSDDVSTKTEVNDISNDEKIKEIARLSGGQQTETSMMHAKELVSDANQYKNSK